MKRSEKNIGPSRKDLSTPLHELSYPEQLAEGDVKKYENGVEVVFLEGDQIQVIPRKS